jgi:hypothetical protein
VPAGTADVSVQADTTPRALPGSATNRGPFGT